MRTDGARGSVDDERGYDEPTDDVERDAEIPPALAASETFYALPLVCLSISCVCVSRPGGSRDWPTRPKGCGAECDGYERERPSSLRAAGGQVDQSTAYGLQSLRVGSCHVACTCEGPRSSSRKPSSALRCVVLPFITSVEDDLSRGVYFPSVSACYRGSLAQPLQVRPK